MTRTLASACSALGSLIAAGIVTAQTPSWPAKPVKLIVAYPPGGGADIGARLLVDPLSKAFGQPCSSRTVRGPVAP